MFKVTFSNTKLVSAFDFASCSSLEEAVSLALAVHRSSNFPHVVCIKNSDGSEVLQFISTEKPKK